MRRSLDSLRSLGMTAFLCKQQFVVLFPVLFSLILPQLFLLDKHDALCYPWGRTEQYLQGGVKFPTGGKVRERLRAEPV